MIPFYFLVPPIGIMQSLLLLTTRGRVFPAKALSYSFIGMMTSDLSSDQNRVYKKIDIPFDQLEVKYARSSGPGGQNVNKLNTKAEIRFKVSEAEWMSEEVRRRLEEQQKNRINKDGELIISSQEHRYIIYNFRKFV